MLVDGDVLDVIAKDVDAKVTPSEVGVADVVTDVATDVAADVATDVVADTVVDELAADVEEVPSNCSTRLVADATRSVFDVAVDSVVVLEDVVDATELDKELLVKGDELAAFAPVEVVDGEELVASVIKLLTNAARSTVSSFLTKLNTFVSDLMSLTFAFGLVRLSIFPSRAFI